MHGTGSFTSIGALNIGGCVVTLTNRRFDPVELLDTIDNRERQRHRHRRRRLRQAHPGRPRRASRAVEAVHPPGHHLVGRDVQRRDQEGAPSPPPHHDADRRLLVLRGPGHGCLGLQWHVDRAHRSFHSRPRGPRPRSRYGQERDTGIGRGGRPGSRWPQSRRVLQGRAEVGQDIQGDRRGAGTRSPATSPRSRPTDPSSSSGAVRS